MQVNNHHTVAILQSNYIPWKGYFDLIRNVDKFIFYDEVQYTKNDWRNRNQIKGPTGLHWLTIPAGTDLKRRIFEVEVNDQRWKSKHLKTIEGFYKKSPHFRDGAELLDFVYNNDITNLSAFNQFSIKLICEYLGIQAKFYDSREFPSSQNAGKTERLIDLLKQTNATRYLSGPAAKNYLDESKFTENNIELRYFEYPNYPEYNQLHGNFAHNVSILDLILNEGHDALKFISSSREPA